MRPYPFVLACCLFVCFYAEVQKEGTAGYDLGREGKPPSVFSFLFLLNWVGLRKVIIDCTLVSWSDGNRGKLQREVVILKASPALGWVLGQNWVADEEQHVVSGTACE